MDDSDLDNLLTAYSERSRRSLPANFQQNVWREIRQRKAEGELRVVTPWSWLLGMVLQPRMVLAAFAFAIVMGAVVGFQKPESGINMTREALDLHVFSGTSSSLPSTLLASNLKL